MFFILLRSGNDQFWTSDAGINYRLPKRYGCVTLRATDLADNEFRYFERDFNNPRLEKDDLREKSPWHFREKDEGKECGEERSGGRSEEHTSELQSLAY